MTWKVYWRPLSFLFKKKNLNCHPDWTKTKRVYCSKKISQYIILFSSEIGIMIIMSIISEMDVPQHNKLNCPSQRENKESAHFFCEHVCYSLQYYFVNELALACSERRRVLAEGSRWKSHFESFPLPVPAIVAVLIHGRGRKKGSYYSSPSLFSSFIV